MKIMTITPRKPDTTIRGGDSDCKHSFKTVGTNPSVLRLRCEKCQASTERATTRAERAEINRKNRESERKIASIHAVFHKFQRRFSDNSLTGYRWSGYELMRRVDKYIDKNPEILSVGVDDSYHSGSSVYLIPHESEKEYWGTTALYVPQCSGEAPIEFFMYPGHLDGMLAALKALKKRQDRGSPHCSEGEEEPQMSKRLALDRVPYRPRGANKKGIILPTHWNYRVVRRACPLPDGSIEHVFGIHEAYYDGDRVTSITVEPIEVVGNDMDDLRSEIGHIAKALDAPVLEYDDIPEGRRAKSER